MSAALDGGPSVCRLESRRCARPSGLGSRFDVTRRNPAGNARCSAGRRVVHRCVPFASSPLARPGHTRSGSGASPSRGRADRTRRRDRVFGPTRLGVSRVRCRPTESGFRLSGAPGRGDRGTRLAVVLQAVPDDDAEPSATPHQSRRRTIRRAALAPEGSGSTVRRRGDRCGVRVVAWLGDTNRVSPRDLPTPGFWTGWRASLRASSRIFGGGSRGLAHLDAPTSTV